MNIIAITANVCCFLFFFFLVVIYTFKRSIKNEENRIYKWILICNFIVLFIELLFMLSIYYLHDNIEIIMFLEKVYFIYILMWIVIFTYYIIIISNEKNQKFNLLFHKNRKANIFILIMLFIVTSFIITILPLNHSYQNGYIAYSYGSAPNFMAGMAAIMIFIAIMSVVINRKQMNKKVLPIFVFSVLEMIFYIIHIFCPNILLISTAITLISYLMYHTIENPDMKMIEQLNIARDQADKANNAKSEFLSNMSHEIRTPLNAIVGFSQALKEENLSEEAMDEVEDIISASSSLLEIVNGILDISKIEAGKLEIVNTEYSFKKVYDELVALTGARIGDKPIEFRLHYDDTIPPVLYGDHTRVKQVILNLLTNAAKYTKEGYIELKVSTVIKGDICRLIISVEDSGIGIKNENISKLFSKFERFDLEKNITIEGTGLGLAITKKLMDLMKGKIVVQSVYGKGSKFTLAIDQKIVPKAALEEKVVEVKETSFEGKKVLVVDDNKLNLKVATRLLKPFGILVEEIDSGIDAIEKIKKGNTYDLILMDDMMPKMSGVETLSYLKAIPNFSIPCIALTANAISGMREKYINAGFDDYLSKPIDKNELNQVLNKFLN